MKVCFWAHPTSWLGQPDDTQFMMDSSGSVLAAWTMVKFSGSIEAQWQAPSIFSKGD